MFCDVLRLIYFLKLPCRTCSVIAYSAGALLCQKIFKIIETSLNSNGGLFLIKAVLNTISNQGLIRDYCKLGLYQTLFQIRA